jgi:hypothetical protein
MKAMVIENFIDDLGDPTLKKLAVDRPAGHKPFVHLLINFWPHYCLMKWRNSVFLVYLLMQSRLCLVSIDCHYYFHC